MEPIYNKAKLDRIMRELARGEKKCAYCGGINERRGAYCSSQCNVQHYLIKVELGLVPGQVEATIKHAHRE